MTTTTTTTIKTKITKTNPWRLFAPCDAFTTT
jgi:hypothetical protein